MNLFKELYSYREMIFSLVRRDLRGKYKGSFLGFLWTFVNPLLQLFVYTFVFSIVMRNGIEKFYLFLFVALVPWIFFSTSVTGGANVICAHKDMVQKIYFPREVLPISFVTSQFVNMLLTFLVIFAVLLVTGFGINLQAIIYLPIIFIVEYLLALGMTLIFSGLTVYFRDLEFILGIVTMAWMYATPVVYSVELVPQELQALYYLNPMTSITIAYRDILYYKRIPELSTLTTAFVLGVIFVVAGEMIFSKLKRHFAEEL